MLGRPRCTVILAAYLWLDAAVSGKASSFPSSHSSLSNEAFNWDQLHVSRLLEAEGSQLHSQSHAPLVHTSLRAFSFLIGTEPASTAQFVFWLIKFSQTPWLISAKEGVENTLCLLAQSTGFSFLQPSLSQLPFQPPPSRLHFLPSSPLHQEVIAKAAAGSCPPGWHCSVSGSRHFPSSCSPKHQPVGHGPRKPALFSSKSVLL